MMAGQQHHVEAKMWSSKFLEMASKEQHLPHGVILEPQMIELGTPKTNYINTINICSVPEY
jgi:hypothetical protein